MSKKFVYLFKEGDGSQRELLGGKGANLAEMTNLGLPVPQGFIVSTEACTHYYDSGRVIAEEIKEQILDCLAKTEEINGKKFGCTTNPLLVAVRSGARASMPGMMDTVLNLGMNDDVAAGLIAGNSDPSFVRFVYDSYRRFIQMFSDVVMELSKKRFEDVIEELKEEKGIVNDIDLSADDMKELVARFKAFYKEEKGEDFPSDPIAQLMAAVQAVFRSWDNPRANTYRRMEGIPYSWGTAVNVQPMVFGNLNMNSGTGVAFTRNPATGEKGLYGDYLINAQGEDVVAGVRTASPISELGETMPEIYEQFATIAQNLEDHYSDMQDMEFTIENGKLYMLQTRNGKRTAAAALRIAIDLVSEGVISVEEAVLRVDPKQLDSLLHPQFDVQALKNAKPIAKGIDASPGAASGKVVFSAEDAEAWAAKGNKVILVRKETCPDDIGGMKVAEGILTAVGGKASHAAVVARAMGTCCVSGCSDIYVDYDKKQFSIGDLVISEGDEISLNGSTGLIYQGKLDTVAAEITGDFDTFMTWADEYRTMKVRTNADTPEDTKNGVEFGAEGIGLCRTEHMFFEGDRIKAMREMIVARDVESRKKALEKILPLQQGDFEEMYRTLEGRPMTIRFLDPPLHEFLPTKAQEIADLAKDLGISAEELTQVVTSLHELNPMMGHRGCRLAVSYPEIAEVQTKAVIRAAIAVNKEHPEFKIVPEIMIPLVGETKELAYVKKVVTTTADAEIAAAGIEMEYMVGTMIEIPRACLIADDIAKEAQFFSFGTNDLTQMAFGFSRDDAGTFLDAYYDAKIFEEDPFGTLDQKGVGKLVKMACELGRAGRPDIKLGICGEHGGDPASVEFCYSIGLDYVSCSPFRVPIARLAAAQAAIRGRENK